MVHLGSILPCSLSMVLVAKAPQMTAVIRVHYRMHELRDVCNECHWDQWDDLPVVSGRMLAVRYIGLKDCWLCLLVR